MRAATASRTRLPLHFVSAGWWPAGRARGAVVAVALHLLLAWWLWHSTAAPHVDRAGAPVSIPLRLLPFEATAPVHSPIRTPRAATAAVAGPAHSRRSAATQARTTVEPDPPQPLPSVVSPPPAPSPAAPPLPAITSRPPALPPLDLDLHGDPAQAPSVQQQAVHDARGNSYQPLSFEERLGRDLDDRATTERLADGSIRHRNGADCAIEHPARTSQLFPVDETSRRAPSAWGPCP